MGLALDARVEKGEATRLTATGNEGPLSGIFKKSQKGKTDPLGEGAGNACAPVLHEHDWRKKVLDGKITFEGEENLNTQKGRLRNTSGAGQMGKRGDLTQCCANV